jgi:hypothetical protein
VPSESLRVSSAARAARKEGRAREQLLTAAALAIQTVLDAKLVALVGVEEDGRLFLLPAPGTAKELMRALAVADWALMTRLAEEHCE